MVSFLLTGSAVEKEQPLMRSDKFRPNQQDKGQVQALARVLWEQQPDILIKEMVNRTEIRRIVARRWKNSTLRNWVKEVAPPEKHKPGRPKK